MSKLRALLRALLSQPTPTAELIACPHWEPGQITMRKGCTACAAIVAEPPRPEDMAPGTTFQVGGESYKIAPSGRILYAGWRLTPWSQQNHQFDPSTIRDVTPPA